jgi:hypothetical protein
MNETWKRIFIDYISCYESIQILFGNNVVDEETSDELEIKLLEEIIGAFRSEVED